MRPWILRVFRYYVPLARLEILLHELKSLTMLKFLGRLSRIILRFFGIEDLSEIMKRKSNLLLAVFCSWTLSKRASKQFQFKN
ncbi:hypothetical protein BG842_08100 [Haladaptatus sp. W1]|nr:hypothetical protein BG842_08100 [Haladaptatus sp. W1]